MRLIINQEPKIFDCETMTVEELLKRLRLPADSTAVTIGASIISRENHAVRKLEEGDNVIIIISTAFGGTLSRQ